MDEKGGIKINLKTFIEVLVGTIALIAIIWVVYQTGWVEASFTTTAAANELGEAVKKISQCIEEKGSECDLEYQIDVRMPQYNLKAGWTGPRGDPEWAIYHDTNLNCGTKNTDKIPDKTQCAPPVKAECSDVWDPEQINPDICGDSICYGIIEASGLFKKVECIEEEAAKKLRPFWMTSPCYARVLVRPTADAKEGCRNCIEVCYIGSQGSPFPPSEWGGDFNFCHNDNSNNWPGTPDAWNDLRCS
ncbi:MAG: hypothetical protein JSV92_01080 [archaeon]|nr:MAG: hypothetical protein JSV92_01080 [archaeon]